MIDPPAIPFARQRLICLLLLLGVGAYAAVTAFVLQSNEWRGLEPPTGAALADLAWPLCAGIVAGAVVMRGTLRRAAQAAPPEQRSMREFTAMLTPVAMLEGGCLLGITTWLLSGRAMPGLAAAGVMFAVAVLLIPFADPGEAS